MSEITQSINIEASLADKTLNLINKLYDSRYWEYKGGAPVNIDIVILNTVCSMAPDTLQATYQSMLDTFKYISKLKMSGIKIYLALMVSKTDDKYNLMTMVSDIQSPDDSNYIFNCKDINNGDILISGSLRAPRKDDKARVDITTLNMEMQVYVTVQALISYVSVPYTYKEIFPDVSIQSMRNKYRAIIFDIHTIEKLAMRMKSLILSNEIQSGSIDDILTDLRKLIITKIGYGIDVEYDVGAPTLRINNAIGRYGTKVSKEEIRVNLSDFEYDEDKLSRVKEVLVSLADIVLDNIRINTPQKDNEPIAYTDTYIKFSDDFPKQMNFLIDSVDSVKGRLHK
jgi:hypothetical protein